MKKLSTIVAATALALAFAAPVPGFAQNLSAYGTIIVTSDHNMSAESMVGKPIYNENHEKIGTIEDLMVKASADEPIAILSVGDYLGGGKKLVAVPLSHLHLEGQDRTSMMMPATKAMLESLPNYSVAGG